MRGIRGLSTVIFLIIFMLGQGVHNSVGSNVGIVFGIVMLIVCWFAHQKLLGDAYKRGREDQWIEDAKRIPKAERVR